MRCWLLAICIGLFAVPVLADDGDGVDPDPLHGLIISGTLKQAIGTFSSHGRPEVGDTFELDLRALPKEKLLLTSKRGNHNYIPFSAPLKILRVKYGTGSKANFTSVYLESGKSQDKFLLHIVAQGREKGSEVTITLYRDGDFIGSMAEAAGTLK
ncbi:hypothetical protein [Anatilimnocola floriformis]|uniref:hypothetical protein n=1 Tax=Anatilimnocola floriformis TaxID=2948575 RepID=UPI0020C2C610|nr:hypothetical protein [Anatilimnocola floriformis]